MSLGVAVSYGTRRPWVPASRRLVEWARTAAGRSAHGQELAIRVVTPAESRRLNRDYRGLDRPTNVLSFQGPGVTAGDEAPALGDLAICAGVVAREARAQHKTLAAHWAHMVVHGTLHLLGYDHEDDVEARRMEKRERSVLARLGFADPYGAERG